MYIINTVVYDLLLIAHLGYLYIYIAYVPIRGRFDWPFTVFTIVLFVMCIYGVDIIVTTLYTFFSI